MIRDSRPLDPAASKRSPIGNPFLDLALLGVLPDPMAGLVFARALEPTTAGPMAKLELGRVAERLGEREKAIESYGFVTEAWRRPDPELQDCVSEARAARSRLTRE